MNYSFVFQTRSDKFASAALRLGPGSCSGFARFYAVLAEQERAIELEQDRCVKVALRDTPQEDAWMNEGGAGEKPDDVDQDSAHLNSRLLS